MKNLLSIQDYIPLTIVLAICILLTIIILLVASKLSQKKVTYEKKGCLLTEIEKRYYGEFCEIFNGRYIVLPQINLASVINKTSQGFRSELFRNVDFGVFDQNFKPICLIEINDPSHLRPDRESRDESVKKICKKAKIPLIVFWTKDGINRAEFIKAFKKIGL